MYLTSLLLNAVRQDFINGSSSGQENSNCG